MNAADKKDVKAAAKVGRRTRIQELGDLSYLLQNASGRRFYWRLMEFCGSFELSYTRGDTHETAFREGMRNVGNRLMADLMEAEPEMYIKMKQENFEEVEDARPGDQGGGSEQDGID